MTTTAWVIDLLLSVTFGPLLPFGILNGFLLRVLSGSLLGSGLGLASLPCCFLAVLACTLLACHPELWLNILSVLLEPGGPITRG